MTLQGAQCADESTPLLQCNEDGFTSKTEETSTREMFWEELRTLPQYALSVLGAQLLEYSMVAVNVISIGHLSTTALAAASLGTLTASVTGFSVLHGLASGLDTVLPAAFTSSQPQLVGLWTQRMAVVMACALVPISLLWSDAEPIFLALNQDPEVSRLAARYLRWLIPTLPAVAWNTISRRYFQSQHLFYVQTNIILCVAPINALINYTLVWGPKSVRLGFIGAPLATAISYYLISIASYVHGRYLVPRTAWHPLSKRMFNDLGILVRLGLSGVAQVTSELWAWEFLTLASSYLGPTSLACQSILVTISTILYQIHLSNTNAATIRIGNLLGEKNAVRAGVASKVGLVISVLSAVITSLILLVGRRTWPRFFNDDPAVISLVSSGIPFVALYQFVDATSVMGAGFLRTRGKQFLGGLLNISAYFIIGFPVGMWLAFQHKLGLPGLWTGLTLALTFNSVIGIILCFRTDWKEEVMKAEERNLREERRQKVLKLVDEESHT